MTGTLHTAARGCRYCIDGYTPAGHHRILGPIYQLCPQADPCPACGGRGVYPVDITHLPALATVLAGHGLAAALCPGCLGITDLIHLTDIPEEEPT